jgi:hypothetical protein
MRSSAYASTVIMSTTYTLSGSLVVVSVISLVAGSGASASLLLLHLEEYLECLLQVIWAGGCYQLLRQKQYPSFFFFFLRFCFLFSRERSLCGGSVQKHGHHDCGRGGWMCLKFNYQPPCDLLGHIHRSHVDP